MVATDHSGDAVVTATVTALVMVPNCWIKSYFCLFPYEKNSRSFITLWLNHWWQMEYSVDDFHTFLDLDSVIYLAINGTVTLWHCAFMGSEQHGGNIFILGWNIPLMYFFLRKTVFVLLSQRVYLENKFVFLCCCEDSENVNTEQMYVMMTSFCKEDLALLI